MNGTAARVARSIPLDSGSGTAAVCAGAWWVAKARLPPRSSLVLVPHQQPVALRPLEHPEQAVRASVESTLPTPHRHRHHAPAGQTCQDTRGMRASAEFAAPHPRRAPASSPAVEARRPSDLPAPEKEVDDWAFIGPNAPSGWPLAPLIQSRYGRAAGIHNLRKPHRIPMVARLVVAAFLRLWWVAVIVTLVIVALVKTYKGETFTAWRWLTYPRVDPTSRLASIPSPGVGSVPPAHDPWAESCPGPLGVPFPYAPTVTYDTPASHPSPAIGEHILVGQRADQCTTYEARYSPYSDEKVGATYRFPVAHRGRASIPSTNFGGREDYLKGLAKEWDDEDAREELTYGHDPLRGLKRPADMGTDNRKDPGNRKWESILRERLYRQNRRAELLGPKSYPHWRDILDSCYNRTATLYQETHPKVPSDERPYVRRADERDAIVLRSYQGFAWREDDILNLRALIVEAGLNCGKPIASSPYWRPHPTSDVCVRKDVRILLEAKNATAAVFTSEAQRLDMLRREVPIEFWPLVEFWSEIEMKAIYPGLSGAFLDKLDAQSSYRGCFMPLQKLHLGHPEYDYIWNWELDVRSLDNYHNFFRGVEEFARHEPLEAGMEKYKTWYVRDAAESIKKWDPKVRSPHEQQAPKPDHLPDGGGEWAAEDKHPQWVPGVGQEADLITLSPMFDPHGSGWFWEYDVANYPLGERTPRRASIGTNVRLSRELLKAMNVVNAEAKKSLHCEAYPPTLVLHSQLPMSKHTSFYPEAGFTHSLALPFKGVATPHPIYFRYLWSPATLDATINVKRFYSRVGGEKVQFQSSHYYNAMHAKEIYRAWRDDPASCRQPALLHPIKRVD